MEDSKFKLHILKKLLDQRCWLHKHMNINNLPKGLPPHARDSKILKRVVKGLIKDEWLIAKHTFYGVEIALNTKKKKDIEEYIERLI